MPVIYEEQRLDLSSYIAWQFLFVLGIKVPCPDITASIKSALHKSSIWSYEKEWRLIDSTTRDPSDDKASAIPFRPVAIYYGRHMPVENKKLLHEIALGKGIKEYEMYLDYSSPLYEMKRKNFHF